MAARGGQRLMTLDPTAPASARASVPSIGARISALGVVSAKTDSAESKGIQEHGSDAHDDTLITTQEEEQGQDEEEEEEEEEEEDARRRQRQQEQLELGTALGNAVAQGKDPARVSSILLQDPGLLAADLSRSGPSYNARMRTPDAPVHCLSRGTTALLIAAQTGNSKLCRLLLSLGADPSSQPDNVRGTCCRCVELPALHQHPRSCAQPFVHPSRGTSVRRRCPALLTKSCSPFELRYTLYRDPTPG